MTDTPADEPRADDSRDESPDSPGTATKVAGAAALAAAPVAAAANSLGDAPEAEAADATLLQEEAGPAQEVQEEKVTDEANPAAEDVTEDSTAQDIVDLTNQARADHGLDPLTVNASLAEESAQWAKTMSTTGMFDHAEGDFSENIHFLGTTASAEEIVKDWMESDGHRANILDPEITEIGVGVSHESNGTYSVQRFS
ncbi:CAP domain-containing protein [Corynebacterium mastitidis]|uniref:CAP domain-containing protein n=1 Tax=Corynebacterium mastitidis TaxID=161890 RepID=UPI0003610643|nr:CAP domain-containing protein [Corynebacterium mastitidis]